MAKDLTNRVALITGGGHGIGRATAQLMAERGADIALLDIDGNAATEVAAEIERLGRKSHVVTADISDTAAAVRGAALVEEASGRIDILVNNAGIGGCDTPFEKVDEALFDRMFSIHVKGAFFLTQAVAAGMKRRRYGRVINISSNRGMVGHSASSHYCAAKAALLGLTKAWARELAPYNICVNAIAPGIVRTDMTLWSGERPLREEADGNLLQRWAEPIEIAYAIAFLVSADAEFITGQVLSPNGGYPIVGI